MFITKLQFFLLSAAFSICSQNVFAGPMGFNDSYMVMGDFNNNWREAFINYAVTTSDAFGVSATYMRSDDKTKTRALEELTYTKLLHRWNMPHAQANLWLYLELVHYRERMNVSAGMIDLITS